MLGTPEMRRARLADFVARRPDTFVDKRIHPELEIRDAAAYPLREPVSGRRYAILRLQSESGLIGYGECPELSPEYLVQAAHTLQGKSASAFEVLTRQLESFPGVQAAANMALLDLLGKFVSAPVYQVLGGPTRFKARVMTALEGGTKAELLASLRRAQAGGFRAFAVPIPTMTRRDGPHTFAAETRRRLDALQDAGGEPADFVLAGTADLPPGHASELLRALEHTSLLWFDEPCDSSDLAALRQIAGAFVTPLGFGRRTCVSSIYLDLLREGVADVLRPDLGLNGILPVRRIAALAETYYVAVAPLHHGGPVATSASLHLAASLPNFFIQQIPFPAAEEDRRMRAELVGTSVEKVEDGFIKLPEEHGLGITVNEKALEKYKERAL